jgi:hypothetical protein
MDAISYSYADKQAKRIKKIINDPDSTSGIVTVPSVIESGETITIPTGRTAVLPNIQIDGTLNIDGTVFIPSGSTFDDLDAQIALKAPLNSPTFTGTPTAPTPTTGAQVANKLYVDINSTGINTNIYTGAYGFDWDYSTDSYVRTGASGYTSIQSMMKRCVLNADRTVNYYLHPTNSNFKANGSPSVLTGADGNVMVEIPKFYMKIETVGNVDKFSISLTPDAGYTAAFNTDYAYYRAYEGIAVSSILSSRSGVTPTRSQTIATFRTQANANGTGWHLSDWRILTAIRMLCYIEFADFNVAKYLGTGNDSGADYGITTGQSNTLGNRSSGPTNNDMFMSYRGIENLYADIWEFIDGVNVNNYQFYVNTIPSTYASDVFTGNYVAKGSLCLAGASASYIKRCSVSIDGGFIPTIVAGSATTFYADGFWSATGARVVLFGGDASDGALDGLGALAVSAASSHSDVNFGGSVCCYR